MAETKLPIGAISKHRFEAGYNLTPGKSLIFIGTRYDTGGAVDHNEKPVNDCFLYSLYFNLVHDKYLRIPSNTNEYEITRGLFAETHRKSILPRNTSPDNIISLESPMSQGKYKKDRYLFSTCYNRYDKIEYITDIIDTTPQEKPSGEYTQLRCEPNVVKFSNNIGYDTARKRKVFFPGTGTYTDVVNQYQKSRRSNMLEDTEISSILQSVVGSEKNKNIGLFMHSSSGNWQYYSVIVHYNIYVIPWLITNKNTNGILYILEEIMRYKLPSTIVHIYNAGLVHYTAIRFDDAEFKTRIQNFSNVMYYTQLLDVLTQVYDSITNTNYTQYLKTIYNEIKEQSYFQDDIYTYLGSLPKKTSDRLSSFELIPSRELYKHTQSVSSPVKSSTTTATSFEIDQGEQYDIAIANAFDNIDSLQQQMRNVFISMGKSNTETFNNFQNLNAKVDFLTSLTSDIASHQTDSTIPESNKELIRKIVSDIIDEMIKKKTIVDTKIELLTTTASTKPSNRLKEAVEKLETATKDYIEREKNLSTKRMLMEKRKREIEEHKKKLITKINERMSKYKK